MCGERCARRAPLSFFCRFSPVWPGPLYADCPLSVAGNGRVRMSVADAFRPGIRPGVLSENSARSARMHENGAEPFLRFRPVGLWEGGIYSRNPTEIVKLLSKGSSAAPPKRQAASQRTGPTMNPHPAAA